MPLDLNDPTAVLLAESGLNTADLVEPRAAWFAGEVLQRAITGRKRARRS